jgi:hypothetical protein
MALTSEENAKLMLVANKSSEILQAIIRGVETYAKWHNADIEDVELVEFKWSCDDKLVITFTT